ncbi:MAG TPA: FHA domain-containing protein [Solirubrobacteraceae bacterium]
MSGPLAGQTIDVENDIVIGREGTDLTIDDQDLSRRHAVVRPSEGRLQVEDLGSTNGTFVDGNRIEEPTLLGGGAEIQLGTTVIVVEGVLPTRESSGDQQATRQRAIPPEFQKRKAEEAAAAAAAPAPAPPARPTAASPPRPAEPLAPFHPPQHGRQRGLASRSWVPVALSYGSVILVAIALVLYFALR